MQDNLKLYFSSVRRGHKSRLVRSGFRLYAWFWYHTEFWLKPLERRPYTFIMRDWIYPHWKAFVAVTGVWYGGLFCLAGRQPYLALALGSLSSVLLAHLVWGTDWKKGQQEWPPYLGEVHK